MFENRLLRRIFEPKRQEVTGGWRNLHKEHHHVYSSPNIIIRIVKLKLTLKIHTLLSFHFLPRNFITMK
jgi:hypothetical protein